MGAGAGAARGTALLGAALIAAGGFADLPVLYAPGVALALCGVGAELWVLLAIRGTRISRVLAAPRAVEGEPLRVEVELRAPRGLPPRGELRDPLLGAPRELRAGRRRVRLVVEASFEGRGRRILEPPGLIVWDPLGLACRELRGAGPDELLVLPRVEPIEAPASGARGARGAGRLARAANAEVDLAGLRAHRPGSPAARIAWPVFARTGELHERALSAGSEAATLVVLDLSGADEEPCERAVRAAASIARRLSAQGGCALLLPGERRPSTLGTDLRGWPDAHVRLALAECGAAPLAGALGAGRRAVVWVSARALREPPRALRRVVRESTMLVVPEPIAGRRASFTVAGCSAYRFQVGRAPGPAIAVG